MASQTLNVAVPKTGLALRVLYGLGSMASGANLNIMGGLLLLFYNQVVGLNAGLASLALGLSMAIDALWDPLVGYVSDNLRSRMGRRHPFMFASIIPIAGSFILLFSPPHGLSQGALFAYLLATVLVLRLGISLYEVPSGALAPELAPDYHDRTVLIGYRWLLGTVGGAIAAVLAYGVFLHKTPQYPMGQLNPAGYTPMAISVAALMAVSILISSLGTRTRAAGLHRPPSRRKSLAASWREVRETMHNWNFGVAVVAGVTGAISASIGGGLAVYFGTFYWKLPAQSILLLVLVGLVSAPLATFIAPLLVKRWGKRLVCMAMFFASVFFYNLPLFLFMAGLFPPAGSPALVVLLMINSVVTGVLGIGGFIVVTSMIADIVEETQVKTGRRSEGLLFSADALAGKIASGFATIVPGVLLGVVHFPMNAKPDTLDPSIMVHLIWISAPLTIGITLVSISVWGLYRIDEGDHRRHLATISARDSGVEPQGGNTLDTVSSRQGAPTGLDTKTNRDATPYDAAPKPL